VNCCVIPLFPPLVSDVFRCCLCRHKAFPAHDRCLAFRAAGTTAAPPPSAGRTSTDDFWIVGGPRGQLIAPLWAQLPVVRDHLDRRFPDRRWPSWPSHRPSPDARPHPVFPRRVSSTPGSYRRRGYVKVPTFRCRSVSTATPNLWYLGTSFALLRLTCNRALERVKARSAAQSLVWRFGAVTNNPSASRWLAHQKTKSPRRRCHVPPRAV
jgi:hypothetical protein